MLFRPFNLTLNAERDTSKTTPPPFTARLMRTPLLRSRISFRGYFEAMVDIHSIDESTMTLHDHPRLGIVMATKRASRVPPRRVAWHALLQIGGERLVRLIGKLLRVGDALGNAPGFVLCLGDQLGVRFRGEMNVPVCGWSRASYVERHGR